MAHDQVVKGHNPTSILNLFQGASHAGTDRTLLEVLGGHYMTRQHVVNTAQRWRRELKDKRAGGKELPAACQSTEAVEWLETHGYHTCVHRTVRPAASTKEKDGVTNGISFAMPHHLEVLRRRGYLSVMDATHDMNRL